MKTAILVIAMRVIALVGCGPIDDGSVQHSLSGATTSAGLSDSSFSPYDYYTEDDEQPNDRPYYTGNGQKVDETGSCGYGFE
jgi:hypothetical protein